MGEVYSVHGSHLSADLHQMAVPLLEVSLSFFVLVGTEKQRGCVAQLKWPIKYCNSHVETQIKTMFVGTLLPVNQCQCGTQT